MEKGELIIRPETVDHLGRVIPEVSVRDATKHVPTPRRVEELLTQAAQYGQYEAYDAVVCWAWSHGITHGPGDLCGHRSRFALCAHGAAVA